MKHVLSPTVYVNSRRGFTLLELIAVMGIIVALSLVIVGGYSGMMRTIAEKAGINALQRAAMLTRQHATIDGRATYFYITSSESYVICRRAGVVSLSEERVRSSTVDLPPYASSGATPMTLWIYDNYADLSGAAEFDLNFIGDGKKLTQDQIKDLLDTYQGTLLFDLETRDSALVTYPPWFDHLNDRWIIGVDKDAPGFDANHSYGWMVYPQQKLPKGYAFVSVKDKFIEEGHLYFNPDGTLGTVGTPAPLSTLSIQELSSGIISEIEILKTEHLR